MSDEPNGLDLLDALAASVDRSRARSKEAMCGADITHRDEEHRMSVCRLRKGHAPTAHDDLAGCVWTDEEHYA